VRDGYLEDIDAKPGAANLRNLIMKKFLLAAGALSALGIAAPAAAQSWGGYDQIHQRFERLEQRIERGAESGRITRGELRNLRMEFRQLVNLDARYRRDGLNRWEAEDLMRRADGLSARIRYERRDDDRRYGERYDDRDGHPGRGNAYGRRW
jgi:hypothetical protein